MCVNLVVYTKGGTCIEGVWQQSTAKNIPAEEGENNRRLEKVS